MKEKPYSKLLVALLFLVISFSSKADELSQNEKLIALSWANSAASLIMTYKILENREYDGQRVICLTSDASQDELRKMAEEEFVSFFVQWKKRKYDFGMMNSLAAMSLMEKYKAKFPCAPNKE